MEIKATGSLEFRSYQRLKLLYVTYLFFVFGFCNSVKLLKIASTRQVVYQEEDFPKFHKENLASKYTLLKHFLSVFRVTYLSRDVRSNFVHM